MEGGPRDARGVVIPVMLDVKGDEGSAPSLSPRPPHDSCDSDDDGRTSDLLKLDILG
jgi:hypothetical protein